MKKIIALFGIISLCGFQAAAESKEIINNNGFETIKGNMPVNWAINDYYKKKNMMGTLEILPESFADGKNCLKIKNDAKQVYHLIMNALTAASPGDVIKMSAYVKGKGSFRLSVYMYDSKNGWLESILPKPVKIDSAEWEKKDFEITLPDKEFGAKGKVAGIRPVIVIDSDSEICIDNFSGKIDRAPAGETDKK